jgi:hypothetical protein
MKAHLRETDTCLCVSNLLNFEETNVVAILAITIAGEQVVTNILQSLVRALVIELARSYYLLSLQINNGAPCTPT